MRCPSLDDLPPPAPGKSGWLWTEASPQPPDVMPSGRPWPRVSIVTPSYNQARFVEETIRSVLLQGYPNLEYIVIDGGSTDGSVEIIRKYESWLASWVSEPDRGQCHAVNKGWERATGDILAYLNSDDFYLPGALCRAVIACEECPSSAVIYCDGLWTDEFGQKVKILKGGQLDVKQLIMGSAVDIPQPTAFIRREAIQSVGGLDESLHMAMDFDLWLRLALRYPFKYIEGEPWAALRFHGTQKTQTRILEDRIDALRAIERAILDPRCPEGITLKGNSLYARLCLDLAAFYQDRGNLVRSGEYLARALQTQPMTTLSLAVYRTLIRTYRAILPLSVQGLVRRMRGIEQPS